MQRTSEPLVFIQFQRHVCRRIRHGVKLRNTLFAHQAQLISVNSSLFISRTRADMNSILTLDNLVAMNGVIITSVLQSCCWVCCWSKWRPSWIFMGSQIAHCEGLTVRMALKLFVRTYTANRYKIVLAAWKMLSLISPRNSMKRSACVWRRPLMMRVLNIHDVV